MKTFARKFLSVTLAAMMLLSMLPTVAFAANSSDDFYRIVHLDNGRKYYSKEWIIALINEMAEAGFNQLQLAFGNDGMRFLLDDMKITVDGTTYSSDAVTEGIQEGNAAYYDEDVNELTEDEMDEILAHADSMGIEIVPHMNMPGHMDAILDAIEYVGISNAHFTGYTTSVRSLNLNNDSAVAFTLALLEKYVTYFADNDCKFFHIGADEFGNDAYGGGMGFPSMGSSLYKKFATFVNDAAAIVKDADMTPRAWNDGISYGNGNYQSTTNYSEEFDTDIQVTYWSSGWGSGYAVAPASTLANNGHDMINTNGDYYYILGVNDTYTSGNSATHVGYDYTAAEGFKNTTFMGTSGLEGVGSMFCIWGDNPGAETEQEVAKYVRPILRVMGARMNDSYEYEVESIVSGGFNEDGSIAVTYDPVDAGYDITLQAAGVTSAETVKLDDSVPYDGYDVSVAYDITVNGGDYTGSAEIKIPYDSIFEGATKYIGDADGDTFAVKLEDGYFTGIVPHFSEVRVSAIIPVGKTYSLASTVESGKNYLIASGSSGDVKLLGSDGSAVDATVDNGKITADSANAWLFSGSNGSYTIRASEGTGNYMYPTASRYYSWRYSLVRDGESTSVSVVKNNNDNDGFTMSRSVSSYMSSTTAYVTYSSESFGASGSSDTLYLFVESEAASYKIDNAELEAAIAAAKALNSADYINWVDLGIDGLITAAENAKDTNTYTDKDEAQKAQDAVNAATTALNNAVAKLTKYPTFKVTVIAYNEAGDEIYRDDTTTVTQNGSVTIDPPAVDGYVIPEGLASQTIVNPTADQVVEFEGYTEIPFDPSTLTPLTIEYWTTNAKRGSIQLDPSTAGFASENGVEIDKLFPAELTIVGDSGERQIEYWKTVYLTVIGDRTDRNPGVGAQTPGAGDDETLNVNRISRVRCNADGWQVLIGDEWKSVDQTAANASYVDGNSTKTYETTKNQLVAYYMEIIDIAGEKGSELHINAADWGKKGDGTAANEYLDPKSSCSISIQVVYEDNKTNPETTTAADIAEKTLVFGYWTDTRGIGTFVLNAEQDYQIYKVTAETGSMSYDSSKSSTWEGVLIDEFSWDDNELTVWEGDLSESVTISNNARKPLNTDIYQNLIWDENHEAILIRVYVRAEIKEAEDKLVVHYIDQSDNNNEFYYYEIGVDSGVVFDSDFCLNTATGEVENATVINHLGVERTVTTNLETLSEIGAQYLYSNYECVKAERSEDGKEVYLYYTFKPVRVFVVDFGLPFHISPGDLDAKLTEDIVTKVEISSASTTNKFGTVSVSGKTITYTPTKVLKTTDAFTVLVTTNTAVDILDEPARQVAFRVYITPASNVLYEETFMDQKSTGVNWTVGGDETGAATEQDKPVADSAPYGYDSNYVTSTGPSGSTYTANLASGELTKNLTVDFTGNGFDLIGTSSPQTGYVYLVITGDATKAVIVDTSHSSKTLYQVPLAHLELGEGDYTATVFGTYREAIEASGTGVVAVYDTETQKTNVMTTAEGAAITANPGTLVEIDGFRVYSSSTNTAFVEEEQGVRYGNILHGGFIESGFAAYVDNSSDGTYTVADYESSGGPQNEVYLAPGQSIAMYVSGGAVQVSLRSVEDETVTAHISNGVTENGDQVTSKVINHSTEMYYEVTPSSEGYLTIKNADGGLLAVGNVKYKPAATSFMALGADNWVSLFSLLDEEPVFTPETFDVEIGSVKLFSKKVTTMTITASLDVEYLKVNGKKVKPVNSWMVKRGLDDEYVFVITKNSKRNADVSFDVVAYDATGMASDVYTIEE